MPNVTLFESDSPESIDREEFYKNVIAAAKQEDAATIASLLARSGRHLQEIRGSRVEELHEKLLAIPGLLERIHDQLAREAKRKSCELTVMQITVISDLRKTFLVRKPSTVWFSGLLAST